MALGKRRAVAVGLAGAVLGGALVFSVVWTGPLTQRERTIRELERELQDQDTNRDDGCAVTDLREPTDSSRPEALGRVRI